jgi:hypothetical protein
MERRGTPMTQRFASLCLGLLTVMSFAEVASAHPGGLNAQGCHNDRKRGGYHCHRSASAPVRSMPPAKRTPKAPKTDDWNIRQGVVGGGTYYRNCSQARAAGAAPVYRGQPGYASHLDRDNDGVGCE